MVALSEVQGKQFEEATVLIAETVGGMEDIPVQSCKENLLQYSSVTNHC